MEKNQDEKKYVPITSNIILAACSGIGAAIVVNPFDLIKTRLQVQGVNKFYKGSVDCFRTILKIDGFFGLYGGLGASLLRQILYCGGRFGTYQYLEDLYKKKFGTKSSTAVCLLNGSFAGAIGSFLAAPTEIVLVRTMADKMFPLDQRRDYKNVIDSLIRITKEEGIITLYRGLTPTIYRGVVLNMIQLGPYYKLKGFMIENYKISDGRLLQLYCGFLMGFISSVATSPMDFAKSKLQEMKTKEGKTPIYKGTFDVLIQVARNEGTFKVYSGFMPYFLRIGTCNIATFIFLEELTKIYLNYI